jgi:hypothetical protein
MALGAIFLAFACRSELFSADTDLIHDADGYPYPELLPFELQTLFPEWLVRDYRLIEIRTKLVTFQEATIGSRVAVIQFPVRAGAGVIRTSFLGDGEEFQ